jgi:hypothetical protein
MNSSEIFFFQLSDNMTKAALNELKLKDFKSYTRIKNFI